MNTHANRGKTLEKAIKIFFSVYESRGIHCQQNHPEQLFDGTLVKKHGFDFQIFYENHFYAFDAKECNRKTWPVDKAKMHQLKALLTVEQNGGDAFFLVWFKPLEKIVKFPASLVQIKLTEGAKAIAPEDGTETTLNILGIK